MENHLHGDDNIPSRLWLTAVAQALLCTFKWIPLLVALKCQRNKIIMNSSYLKNCNLSSLVYKETIILIA